MFSSSFEVEWGIKESEQDFEVSFRDIGKTQGIMRWESSSWMIIGLGIPKNELHVHWWGKYDFTMNFEYPSLDSDVEIACRKVKERMSVGYGMAFFLWGSLIGWSGIIGWFKWSVTLSRVGGLWNGHDWWEWKALEWKNQKWGFKYMWRMWEV